MHESQPDEPNLNEQHEDPKASTVVQEEVKHEKESTPVKTSSPEMQ